MSRIVLDNIVHLPPAPVNRQTVEYPHGCREVWGTAVVSVGACGVIALLSFVCLDTAPNNLGLIMQCNLTATPAQLVKEPRQRRGSLTS